jgi:hypothetical protein
MKNVYIKLIFIITFFFLFSCSSRNYVIYNAIEGKVVSSKDQKPIEGAKIYVNKGSSNDFGIINTTKNGTFFIEGLELPYKYLHDQLNLSFDYFIEKPGFKKKVINIKNLKETNNNKLDTIDLGEIYLEPEE